MVSAEKASYEGFGSEGTEKEREVLELLCQLFATDIVYPGKGNELARLLKRLEALGEDKVYEAARMALEWEMNMF